MKFSLPDINLGTNYASQMEGAALKRPPPIVHGAKVIAYATVDEPVTYIRKDLLFIDGRPIGRAPKLVIGSYPFESEYMLFYCAGDWESLGGASFKSIEAAKRRAESEYRGVAALWRHYHHDNEDEIDRQLLDPSCSVCGLSHRKVDKMLGMYGVYICGECFLEVEEELRESGFVP